MSALNKIAANSTSRQNPSELETSIAGALYDLEVNTADLKAALRPLQFVSAKEIEINNGKKAIVIFVPVPSLLGFHRVQQRLTRELEKNSRNVTFLYSHLVAFCLVLKDQIARELRSHKKDPDPGP
ncbi:Protein component of the small (40S) ribosomal subunit [Blumeria graminis f. sp. tritici 96224]|uniref:40S ribosomal protein S7 n=1 Tax=Blumeria graminis f. sp. tritici 96224 TaxID=1268274 RepID=A0A656KFI8_BLUGR|nr:Protein component of the small (40S) ribosomal subunit [Blumeria graminis f. sp. tritici 96224]